jgi:outer membrane protein assembly factor BamB
VTYAEGLAYFVDSRDQGRLVALNRYTGSKVWELAGMKSCNAFIKTDGAGYVKTHDGVVHAIAFKG